MKNKKLRNGLLAVSLLVLPILILAAVQSPETPITSVDQVESLILKVRNWIFTIFLIVAVIFVVMAAFGYLTSGGDPAKVKTAQQQLIYAVVAIAVALIAGGIVAVVRNFITP